MGRLAHTAVERFVPALSNIESKAGQASAISEAGSTLLAQSEELACALEVKEAEILEAAAKQIEKNATRTQAGVATEATAEMTETVGEKVSKIASKIGAESGVATREFAKCPKREITLPKVATYEQARNKALEIIGEVNEHFGKPHVGRLGIGEAKVVGRSWHGKKVIMRLDYDPIKGPHINVSDYRLGKGINGKTIAIPFEGDIETVKALLKHLNR